MGELVRHEAAFLGECLSADFTCVVFLFGVHEEMRYEAAFQTERLSADFTCVGSLLGVADQMGFKVRALEEVLSANSAEMWSLSVGDVHCTAVMFVGNTPHK